MSLRQDNIGPCKEKLTCSFIFEELLTGVAVPLLQLPAWHGYAWATERNILQNRQAGWPLEQPWFV